MFCGNSSFVVIITGSPQVNMHRAPTNRPPRSPTDEVITKHLLVTLRGRGADKSSPFHREPWHLHSSHDGKLHVFADELDLRAFHAADVLAGFACDSRFPTGRAVGSPYRIFGVACRLPGGEVTHCGFGLVQKDSGSFRDVWERLREASEARFGQRTSRRLVLCDDDDEPWAIGDLRAVFPDDAVRVSSSYFRGALWRKLTQLGLATVYENDSVPGVREWLRRILAMTRLPAHMVPQVWQWCLGSPPRVVNNPSVACALYAFGLFVENEWVYSVSHPPDAWTHFDVDDGPGSPADLGDEFSWKAKHALPSINPRLVTFLKWLQQCHHANQLRLEQLLGDESNITARVSDDVGDLRAEEEKVREELDVEKRRFVVEFDCRMGLSPCDMAVYRDVVLGYLSRCADVLESNPVFFRGRKVIPSSSR